jgi:hypothetical protein
MGVCAIREDKLMKPATALSGCDNLNIIFSLPVFLFQGC